MERFDHADDALFLTNQKGKKMKSKYIAAYTEQNDWPAFINVSRLEDGNIIFTVRDRGNNETGASNNIIELTMGPYAFIDFVEELKREFGEGRQVTPHIPGRST